MKYMLLIIILCVTFVGCVQEGGEGDQGGEVPGETVYTINTTPLTKLGGPRNMTNYTTLLTDLAGGQVWFAGVDTGAFQFQDKPEFAFYPVVSENSDPSWANIVIVTYHLFELARGSWHFIDPIIITEVHVRETGFDADMSKVEGVLKIWGLDSLDAYTFDEIKDYVQGGRDRQERLPGIEVYGSGENAYLLEAWTYQSTLFDGTIEGIVRIVLSEPASEYFITSTVPSSNNLLGN